jgi:hypothetical protein
VITKYGNHRTYKILDVDFTRTPKSLTGTDTFIIKDHDPSITFVEYFQSTYNVGIRDLN